MQWYNSTNIIFYYMLPIFIIDVVVNVVGCLPKDGKKLGTHDKYEDSYYWN